MRVASLFTRQTNEKGWGVFTDEAIPADTVIEVSPVVVMSAEERKLLDKTRLHDYIFEWEGGRCCMALGLLPVYNHASPSNCEYFQDYEASIMYVKTMRPVEAGEELTINYNGDWNKEGQVWFEVKD